VFGNFGESVTHVTSHLHLLLLQRLSRKMFPVVSRAGTIPFPRNLSIAQQQQAALEAASSSGGGGSSPFPVTKKHSSRPTALNI